MNKILVIGCPGSGKSTFARRLQGVTGLPLYYLDMLWHNPDKTNISREEFDRKLGRLLLQSRRIIDGNYLRTLELRLKESDTVFLFDLPLEDCLDGAKKRVGAKREDMPWIEEEFDEEFRRYICEFPSVQLPQIYKLLAAYPQLHKEVFHSRGEADIYIDNLRQSLKQPS